VPARQAGNRFLGSLTGLQIGALTKTLLVSHKYSSNAGQRIHAAIPHPARKPQETPKQNTILYANLLFTNLHNHILNKQPETVALATKYVF
jgi:hypothetical protein